MEKQISVLMGNARAVLSRTDVVDQLYALDSVLFRVCPKDADLIAAHTMNHVAFMVSLAHTQQDLDKVLALMDQVRDEIVATKRQTLAGIPPLTVVH